MQASSDGSPPFVEFNCHSVQRKTRVLKLTSSFHCKIILSSLQFGQPLFYLAWCGWLVISKEVLRDRPQARAGNTMSEYILAPWGVECLQLAIVSADCFWQGINYIDHLQRQFLSPERYYCLDSHDFPGHALRAILVCRE